MAKTRWFAVTSLGACLMGAGCGELPSDAGVEGQQSELVQFGNAATTFGSLDGASETSILVNQTNGRKVVAYNSEDHAHITYSATDRVTFPGASLMGWSWSPLAIGSTYTRNRVPADTANGFPIIWGDPSLSQLPGTNFMYLVELAAVQSKMPPNGQPIHGAMDGVMGGACIARSTNGGANFTLQPQDCISDAAKDFYDGTATVATSSPQNVFAAFNNVPNSRIDVWQAPSATAAFRLAANPFPGKLMCDHPRIATDSQNAYILGADCSGNLWLSCMGGTTVCTVGTWPMLVGSGYTGQNSVTINGVVVRKGAQYDIAINNVSQAFGQWADIIYATTGASGNASFQEAACHLFGTPHTCTPRGFVNQGAGVNVFHPSLAVADFLPSGGSEQAIYQAAWMQQVGTGVQLWSGVLNGPGGGTGRVAGRSETGTTNVCADKRGYWGDYNNHLGVDQASRATAPRFWAAFSDSTDNSANPQCTQVNAFNSVPVNVSTTWINFP